MATASTSTSIPNPSITPPSLLHHTLITAPIKVVYNTFYFTTAGALTGATIGVYKSIPAIPTAFKTGLNIGIFSFTFFSIREYLLHPTLSLLLPSLHPYPPPSPYPTRTNNLLSTSISGTITGSLYTYFTRGSKGSIRGGFTLGLGCLVLQGVINEIDLGRVRALGWSEERRTLLAEQDEEELKNENKEIEKEIPTYTRSISTPTPNVPSRETFSERSDRLIGSSFNSFKRGLERISPVRKMKEGDYELVLESRLKGVDEELEVIRGELEELRKSDK